VERGASDIFHHIIGCWVLFARFLCDDRSPLCKKLHGDMRFTMYPVGWRSVCVIKWSPLSSRVAILSNELAGAKSKIYFGNVLHSCLSQHSNNYLPLKYTIGA